MDNSELPRSILIILALLVGNAFFAAAEIAMVTVRRTRIKQLVEEGDQRAKVVQGLLEHPTHWMATVQIGVTLVGLFAAAVGAIGISEPLAVFFRKSHVAILAHNAQGLAVIAITLMIGYLTLVLGEIAPKSFAMQHAERLSLMVGGILRFVSWLLAPAVHLVSFSSDLLLKPFGARARFTAPILTEEELKMLVQAGEDEGVLEEEEKEMIHSIFEFTDTTVKKVMVPRIDMKCIEVGDSIDELLDLILECGHTRIPVYEETVDRILGVVHAKDLLNAVRRGKDSFSIRDVMRPAYFIPEGKMVDELLGEFKLSKIQMAIVRDEYGGTDGLVTIEDLLEEIVGEIQDEYDVEQPLIQKLDETTAVISARLNIDDLNEELGLQIPEEDEYETVGGFVFGLFGRQPEAGESVSHENVDFTVEAVEGGRIQTIRVVRKPMPAQAATNENGRGNGDQNSR